MEYHSRTSMVRQLIDFSKVGSLNNFTNVVEKVVKSRSNDIVKLYSLKKQDAENKFRGDVEEIFVYYLIVTHLDTFNLSEIYFNNQDDMGVDLYGKHADGKSVCTMQVKYVGNPTTTIGWNDKHFGNFLAQSLALVDEGGFGVTTKKHTYFFARHGIPDKQVQDNFIHVRGKYYNEQDLLGVLPGLKSATFWSQLQDYVLTYQLPTKIKKTPYAHQIRIQNKIMDFLKSNEERGFVVAPTGAGKTVSIATCIEDAHKIFDNVVTIVASPRIRLSSQIKEEIYNGTPICSFHSDSSEKESAQNYNGGGMSHTSDEVEIKDFIKNNKQCTIVTTYHSLEQRLGKYIDETKENKKVIVIADECHNVVRFSDWSKLTTIDKDICKFDKLIGFTATPINTYNELSGGMNHMYRWGKLLCGITYKEMFHKGLIVPPVWETIDDKGDVGIEPEQLCKKGLLKEQELCKQRGTICKVLIKCKSRESAFNLHATMSKDLSLAAFKFFKVFTSDEAYTCGKRPHKQIEEFKQIKDNAVLFYVNMISEGIDIPDCTVLSFFKEVTDVIEMKQAIGRIMRPLTEERSLARKDRKKQYGYVILPEHNEEGDSTKYDTIRDMIESIKQEAIAAGVERNEGVEHEGVVPSVADKYVDEKDVKQLSDADFEAEVFDIEKWYTKLDEQEISPAKLQERLANGLNPKNLEVKEEVLNGADPYADE